MAHRVIKKYPRSPPGLLKEVKQHFNYLLVLDFEATCKQYEILKPQEIIEFPCAAVSTTSWQIENVFHEYVKPRVHPNLTSFCTTLTGIIQEMVDSQPHFPEVFDKFQNWLEENKFFKNDNKSAFVTNGHWDLRVMLPSQCRLENITLPPHFTKWIDLKESFFDATNHYPRSMPNMLTHLKLPLEGRLHSGIDDVKNMVTIIQTLQKNHNVLFKVNCAPDVLLKHLRNNYILPQRKN
ncbi:ERI1 exoribonuclease 3 [Halictus rubicundus]|uniref:ERI1 exoribonuclease 3 n=1 Tax=Halictus rubicundus TaxID=77578 RepID=UPI004036D376